MKTTFELPYFVYAGDEESLFKPGPNQENFYIGLI